VLQFELSWQAAAVTSGCLIGSAVALRLAHRAPRLTQHAPPLLAGRLLRHARVIAAFTQEAGTLIGLFALWQLAGSQSVMNTDGALSRAQWLWHTERVLHIPSEAAVQRFFLPHPLMVQAFNLYYAGLHFVVLTGCLIWLFVRHRDSYFRVRTTVVLFTGFSLLVQFIPVAPPRMLSTDGMVDTAVQYGQSVYGSVAGFNPDQLSAMPSVHVGWALLVAIVIVNVSRSRWRWLALAYPVLTTLAVVVTANHFWLDGAAAAILLALALLIQRAGQVAGGKLTHARAARHPGDGSSGQRMLEATRGAVQSGGSETMRQV
jgi:PAP2 superfamily